MAKSKNHTAHNQNKKGECGGAARRWRGCYVQLAWTPRSHAAAHRNGITKVQTNRHKSMKGVDPKVSEHREQRGRCDDATMRGERDHTKAR